MKRKYWVLSPNVMNGADETEWKNAISKLKRAFIFNREIKCNSHDFI